MKKFRYILFPFTLLYAGITSVRNWLYDKQIIKSVEFELPVINVGNLSVGGTGKTPMIEYLIRLLQPRYKIAVVSRGYKRKTKGFIVADDKSTPEQIGDEPYQIFRKFEDIIVAVGEDRVEAVRKVLVNFSPDVILLDDAFQHRRIKAGLNILLTPFDRPFTRDFILPAGDLRESRKNAKRADIVLVTKSPAELSPSVQKKISKDIQSYTEAPVYFSFIRYVDSVISKNASIPVETLKEYGILVVTGIARPEPLLQYLSEKNLNFDVLKFSDHHHFSKADIQKINKSFNAIKAKNKLILTTEKDFVRLQNHFSGNLYYLPINTEINEKNKFNQKILDYVRK